MKQFNPFAAKLFGLIALVLLASCSSTPMKARLDKNFIYNCALELIDKGVNPADANIICKSSHEAELAEAESSRSASKSASAARTMPASQPSAAGVVLPAATEPQRGPASIEAPK